MYLNLVADSTRSVVIEVEYGLWEKCYSSQENNTLYNSCVKFLDNKDDTPGKKGQSNHKGTDISYLLVPDPIFICVHVLLHGQ